MSIPPLKVRMLNDNCVDLCKFVAKKVGLTEGDSNLIFHFEKEKMSRPRTILYSLSVEEGRPVRIKEKGQIVEILGDNQVGKTTTLLYIANLLGYDFHNEDNIDFLADEKLVKQGQEIFSKLVGGMKAKLEIDARPYKISIWTEDGWIKVEVTKDTKIIMFKPFDLGVMSDAFRNSITPFIRVQFISKGRNFDWQLLMDISNEMKFYVGKIQERTQHLINNLRSRVEESMKEAAITEGIDFNTRKQQIANELENLKGQRDTYNTATFQLKLKLNTLTKLLNQIPDMEKTESFEVFRRIYELETNLSRSRERLQNFEKSIEKAKEIETNIESQNTRLQMVQKEMLKKRGIYESVENKFNQVISTIEQNISKFSDESRAYSVLKLLRNREIDLLMEERKQAEPEAIKVIEDLCDRALNYNATIRLPMGLGGSVAVLQENFGKAKKVVLDQNLTKSATDPLLDVLSENQIASSEMYRNLLNGIRTSENETRVLNEDIKKMEKTKLEMDSTQDEKMLVKTKSEIKVTQDELQRLREKMKGLKKNDIDRLTVLEKNAALINPDDPKSLIYSADWADKALKVREELQKEFGEKEEKIAEIQQSEEKLREEAKKIASILSSIELEEYSRRIDHLNDLEGIMITLSEILGHWRYLINRDKAEDQFLSLDRHGITSVLDEAINEMLLERCSEYFRLVDENKFETETITKFDYRNRSFICDDHAQSIISLSGGTASIMTVLSLASKMTDALLGTALLVDEFHDVAETLRLETYTRLIKNKNLSFSFFAKPLDRSPLITRPVDLGS